MDAEDRRRLQEALVRLADGDRSAFHPVFFLCWPIVKGFTQSFMRGAADAQDAAQSALLRVFARAGEFDRRREALSWILGIAAYECRTMRRRAQRRREEGLDAVAARAAGPSPEEELLRADLGAAAREVLAGLPRQDVETLLAVLEDDAAGRPAIAPATFRKRLERARRRLRQAWRERHGIG